MRPMLSSTRAMLAAYLVAGCADGLTPSAANLPDLTAHQGRHRVLVISTPSPHSAEFVRQRAALEAATAGLRERDVEIVTQVATAFRIRLVGKDGGVKLDSRESVDTAMLFALIDAMPMRQAEMSGR